MPLKSAISFMLIALSSFCAHAGASAVEVRTRLGTLAGLDASQATGTYAWLGVPYAQAPVGSLRWMPPVAPAAWKGARTAQKFGASCAQAGRFYSPAPNDAPFGLAVRDSIGKPVGSEDCLTLNIWRPANTRTRLPVIVFIHGGSNISGYTADPIYDGAALAKKVDAVVVSINYRLGLFGWLDLQQLKTGDARGDSGNFATLDQVRALEFIRDNIGAFGGDAVNVTVMGQSAGAVNTWALLVMPSTSGLFHKAAPLSGGLLFATPTASREYANALLNAIVVADGKASDATTAQAWIAKQTDVQIAAYLRGKSAEDLLKVVIAKPQLGIVPGVIADGTVVPADPLAAITAGNYRQVPILAGNTRDEGKLFGSMVGAYKPNEYDRFTLQFTFKPDAQPTLTEADLLNAAFLPIDKQPGGWNAAAAMGSGMFLTQAKRALDAVSAKQPKQVWYYRYDWDREPTPFDTVYGAAHALDVPFIFGNFGPSVFSFAWSKANAAGREELSDQMMRSIGAFARSGDPNDPSLSVSWPNWPATLVFDASDTQAQISVQ